MASCWLEVDYEESPYPQEQSPLWNSGYPTPVGYTYATFHYGDSYTYPNQLGTQAYNGFKWRLKCRNAEYVEETRLMYGKPIY